MNASTLIIAIFCVILAAASTVMAGNQNVRFTLHNMSNNTDAAQGLTTAVRTTYSAEVDQVCVFCHTPHHAKPAIPLWNKYIPNYGAGYFKMYTSSRSLSATARSATAPGPTSLLCLSCHDGKTAINVLHNAKYGTAAVGYDPGDRVIDMGFGPAPFTFSDLGFKTGVNLGGTDADPAAGNVLNDDHPIGFSYTQAASQNTKLKTTVDSRIRFFPPNNSIECSSCHDPHVNYNTDSTSQPGDPTLRPFLVMSNVGSALCLSCHDK